LLDLYRHHDQLDHVLSGFRCWHRCKSETGNAAMNHGSDLISMLRSAYEQPFSTDHDPRHLLLLAANALERQKETIWNLIVELAKAKEAK
jgi:hypothetical protein